MFIRLYNRLLVVYVMAVSLIATFFTTICHMQHFLHNSSLLVSLIVKQHTIAIGNIKQ